ncbi:MAG: hypothetical protein Q8L49_01630 [Burkholderiaceae bacterium]|nr:hypothetical protein [Burkholderiaceae bacterium]
MAAVEFVTPVGTCSKVDTIGDGKDLSLQAGNDVRFEVWGDGIDINPAVRITVDDNNADALVTARIIRAHNGVENLGRGCKIAKGSVEVEVDSPAGAGATRQRSLRFRMPAGDESRLQMRVVPFRTPVWTFGTLRQRPTQCLTRTIGTVVRDLDNSRMTITLPPGANGDTSNCVLEFETTVAPSDRPEIDIQRSFGYTVTSPAHMRLTSGHNTADGALASRFMLFTGDVANIRGTRATRTSTLTVATPNPNRSDTLTLVINPPPTANAFTQACICRNATTGTTINANDDFQCEIRLAQQPAAAGQLISFEAQDRLCVAGGANNVTYSSASGLGSFTAPSTSTFHQIPLRALGGNTSASPPTPCASLTSPVAHTLKFWVGARGAESGPAFTQCQIRIRSPQ